MQSSLDRIARLTIAGVITDEYQLTAGTGPVGITAGPDGALWFTESAVNKIGRTTAINPGSEYGDGNLRGALVNLKGSKLLSYQLVNG